VNIRIASHFYCHFFQPLHSCSPGLDVFISAFSITLSFIDISILMFRYHFFIDIFISQISSLHISLLFTQTDASLHDSSFLSTGSIDYWWLLILPFHAIIFDYFIRVLIDDSWRLAFFLHISLAMYFRCQAAFSFQHWLPLSWLRLVEDSFLSFSPFDRYDYFRLLLITFSLHDRHTFIIFAFIFVFID
jgi:hypothetical protein